ncbi:MAG TPA: hypothetical protein VM512_07875 [Burkholderiaceae bacterium]|jgi:hypothetical protein|nr:hypothetical protein [Burkholderiaceae bacterium]
MPEPVSVLPRSSARAADAASIPVSILPADRLRNTLTALAANCSVGGASALRTSPGLAFWSALPDWFCDQSHQLIERALNDGHAACAVALARHLILRRASLQSIDGQVSCLQELHELRHDAIEPGMAGPPATSTSAYENACVAVCLRLLSQHHDPFRWRHRIPAALAAQERAFDAAVFRFCQVEPVVRPAAAHGARRGVGFAPARALILAALQQYFGMPFIPHPVSQRTALTDTLGCGLPLVIVGGSGPIDGDDTRHAWVCQAWQSDDGQADIFDPAPARAERQLLDAFLDRLSADSLAFVRTPA